jgi:deazaflavin-dependent oxidoreductase (nitroreductase family)
MAGKFDILKVVKDLDSGKQPKWIREHLRIYQESGGKEGHFFDASATAPGAAPIPTLLLTTVGAKSGQKRTTPLLYGKSGEDFIIIGSKGGSETHTAWYYNLRANPDAEIQVATDHFKVRARMAQGAERVKLWDYILTVWPNFAEYQSRTSREIPVWVLEKQ